MNWHESVMNIRYKYISLANKIDQELALMYCFFYHNKRQITNKYEIN